MSLLETAKKYRDAGLSIVGCNRKRANVEWTPFKSTLPTDEDIDKMFNHYSSPQIAVICGKVSGGLEVIDVDTKNDTTGTLWDDLLNDLLDYFHNDMPLLIAQTASGGMHIYYRCLEIEGNKKLASVKESGKTVTIIETRGEGGYVIAPPSPNYTCIAGKDLCLDIPTIKPETRTDILDICRKYNAVFKEETKKASGVAVSVYRETPWDAYNDDPADPWRDVLITKGWVKTSENSLREYWQRPGSENKWSATWNNERRLFYVFTTSSEFQSEKAYSPFAIYAVLNCHGNFSEATKLVRAAGYGLPFTEAEKPLISRVETFANENLTWEDIFIKMLPLCDELLKEDLRDLSKEDKEKKIKEDLPAIINAGIQKAKSKTGLFWSVKNSGTIKLSYCDLADFLSEHGFYLMKEDARSTVYRIVKVDKEDHLISQSSIPNMKQFLKEWVMKSQDDLDIGKKALLNSLIERANLPNTIEWMGVLKMTDFKFLRDTARDSYLPFKNGIVHITADDIDMIYYQDLPENVLLWADQIRERDIDLLPIQHETEFNQHPIYRFFKRLAGITPDIEHIPIAELVRTDADKANRFRSLLSTLGYLMSNYKNPVQPYCVILVEDTDDSDKGGGAGKGLFFTIINEIRKVHKEPGKNWDAKGQFAYQKVTLGTDIFVLEDIPANFKFDLLYNTITEGMVIEKKHQDAFTIEYAFSPKIGITTNYTIDSNSDHASRRQRILFFNKYFSDGHTPADEFGGLFFGDSWTNTDWQLFYNFCFFCIRTYIRSGIFQFQMTENVMAKDIKTNFTPEFFAFIIEYLHEYVGKWKSKSELYEDFLESAGFKEKDYSSRRFNKACEMFSKSHKYQFVSQKSRSGGTRSKHFCIFVKLGDEVPPLSLNDAPF